VSGPFDGITVVEFGQFVVVPFCAQLLADGGARVIKVEPPTGDSYRSGPAQLAPGETRQFMIKNRGKESVSLDLGHPDAAPVVRRLVSLADVVLVNLSPAAVLRRGLDYQSLATMNPSVVYGAVSAYGSVGPESGLPGMDVVVQARSGLMSSLAAEQDGVPHHSEVQVADYSSALLLFAGIASALYVRERTGLGQRVDVSLLGGALAVQNNSLAHVYGADDWRPEFVEALSGLRRANATHAQVEQVRRSLRPDPPTHTAHYRAFRTADGDVALGAGSPAARRRLAVLTGLDETLALSDPDRFGTLLAQLLRTQPSAHWVSLLQGGDVPVAAVRHVDEVMFDPHVEAEELLADYDHPVVGRYRALAAPLRMSATPLDRRQASPSFAADTAAVLRELGFDEDELSALQEAGAVVCVPPGIAAPSDLPATTSPRSP